VFVARLPGNSYADRRYISEHGSFAADCYLPRDDMDS